MQLAQYLAAGIRAHKPDAKIPKTPKDLQSWAREFDLMLRIDKRPRDAITAVIDYATTNTFWRRVVFSADKLRQKFDTLDCQRQDDGGNGNGPVLGNRRGHAGRERPSAGSPSGPPNVRRFTEEWYAERERVHNARGLGSSSAADRARSTAQATG